MARIQPDRRPFFESHPFRVLFLKGYRYHTNVDAAIAGVGSPVCEIARYERGEWVRIDAPHVPASHAAVLECAE